MSDGNNSVPLGLISFIAILYEYMVYDMYVFTPNYHGNRQHDGVSQCTLLSGIFVSFAHFTHT